MTEPSREVRRGAGRPTRAQAQARDEQLLDAALDLFLQHGFDLATIEMIAAEVNMTKRTVYARYRDKASLFHAAAQRAIERQVVPRQALIDADNGDLAATLETIAHLRISQVMTPNGIRLQRIINTESYRFPKMFAVNYELSAKPVIDFVAGLLRRAIDKGEITPTEPHQAAQAFLSLVVGGWVRALVIGRQPSQDELNATVHFTVTLLLNGLRPR